MRYHHIKTEQNVRRLTFIANFVPDNLKALIMQMISVEEHFDVVSWHIDNRETPAPTSTYALQFKLADMLQAYLRFLRTTRDYSDLIEVEQIIERYYVHLKNDKEASTALIRAYSRGKNSEVEIYNHFSSHFLEIHRLMLSSLFATFDKMVKKMNDEFTNESVNGLKMLPKNFKPNEGKLPKPDATDPTETMGVIPAGENT
jgi:hypothetical protein